MEASSAANRDFSQSFLEWRVDLGGRPVSACRPFQGESGGMAQSRGYTDPRTRFARVAAADFEIFNSRAISLVLFPSRASALTESKCLLDVAGRPNRTPRAFAATIPAKTLHG